MDFVDLLYYLQNLKMLRYLGKWIQNLLDKKRVLWESCEYFGYFKGFCEITWNWNVFWFHVNCEFFMFLPLSYDMWLTGDYLARYYSLCDNGILAPVFVMVIKSGFVSVNYFRLCVDNELWLCINRLVLALCRQWVPTLCR